MTEAIPEYRITNRALPCPFCGSENITSNEWTVGDDHADKFEADEFSEVWAFECSDCLGAAPMMSWNTRHSPTLESTVGWHYPRDNSDMDDMPAPGQIVVLYYEGDDGQTKGPVISTPVHKDPESQARYMRTIRWHEILEE